MGARKDLALRAIRAKFAEWRRTKRHGDSIPAALWDEVHALEERVGRTRLALELGLNASELGFQLELRGSGSGSTPGTACPKASVPAATATTSVAITKVVSVPMPPPLARAGGAAIEVEAPSGWILRLQAEASPDFVRVFVEATGRAGGVR
jgi:hypothetical protein